MYIYISIFVLIVILLSIIMKPFKLLLKVLLRGGLGLGAIYLCNIILTALGLFVGINIVNGLVIGLLGLPGFLLLYSLAAIDKFL